MMGRATRAGSVKADAEEEEQQEEQEEGSEEEEGSEGSGSNDSEEDDEDDESEEEEEEDDEVPIENSLAFGREKRATMGKRMGGLVGEEQDKDETFWGDSKWNVDDAESEYSNASESGDEVDSDFSASEDEDAGEDEEDVEAEQAVTAREKRQQQQEAGARAKYKEPKRKGRPAAATAAAATAMAPHLTPEEMERLKQERKEAARLRREAALLAPVDRAKRATTQQKTVAMQDALVRREQEQAKQPVVRAPRETKCTFQQEELLVEAACATEQENARWLLGRKRSQNESDTTAHAPKRQVKLAARFISRRGANNVVNFPEVDLMPDILKGGGGREKGAASAGRRKGETMCAITGLPAKYFDPLTRQPYATLEAFKALRADPRYLPQDDMEEEEEEEEEEEGVGRGAPVGRGLSRSSWVE